MQNLARSGGRGDCWLAALMIVVASLHLRFLEWSRHENLAARRTS